MALQQMQDFTFKHSQQIDELDTMYTSQQVKALFDSRGDELKAALDLLITTLKSTEGANDIGTSTIQDIDGTTIQTMLKSIRDKLKSKVDGASGADFVNATAIEGLSGETVQALIIALKKYIDTTKSDLNKNIDTHKLSNDHDNRYYTETEIDTKINDLAGTGRTKETVKSISDSIELHKTSSDHDVRYFTQDQLKSITNGNSGATQIGASPIASGSGATVQQQLAWLLSQIAVAATGDIPDGSLGEAKLSQAIITKINMALSNTGTLSTLLTIDKSSTVNAINEVIEKLIILSDTEPVGVNNNTYWLHDVGENFNLPGGDGVVIANASFGDDQNIKFEEL